MKTGLILSMILGLFVPLQANDTIRLNIQQADSIFLSNNLLLIAAQLNVEANEALKIQARLWPNPNLSFDFNAIDPENKRTFHAGNTGQKSLVFEQLFLTAGKRKEQIKLAAGNAELALAEFSDLLRELRYKLYTHFFKANQQIQLMATYDKQLVVLDSLIETYNQQAAKGNITVKDVIRLKSAYFGLNNERTAAYIQLNEDQKEIRTILQLDSFILPLNLEDWYRKITVPVAMLSLLDSALRNRPDLHIARIQADLSNLNLRIQKKQNIPDINFIASYDQRGGAFTNQINAGLGFTLPFWNRNTGNIRYAATQVRLAETMSKVAENRVKQELVEAFEAMNSSVSEYLKINNLYSSEFDEVINGVNQNFKKRNISMLEFMDFFEAYISAKAEYERVRGQLAFSAAYLNYITSSSIY